jgi:hypothetical protein
MRAVLALLAAVAALALAACSDEGGTAATTEGRGTTTLLDLTDAGLPPAMAVQDDRLVNADADPAERVALVDATGARVARVDVFWKDVAPERPADPADPRDPAYRWDRVDEILTRMEARDITPIVAVYNAPAWATGGVTTVTPTMPYNTVPPDPAAFAAFMEAISTRYSGDVRTGDGRLPRVRYWELWNEPNLSLFLAPPGGTEPWLDMYADLVRAGYPAVKRGGGAGTRVLVGAAGPRSSTGTGAVSAVDWLRGLRDRDVPLDVYSQHIYPSAAPRQPTPAVPSWGTLQVLLDDLEAWRPGLQIAITEAGYTTTPTPYRKTFVSEEQQAQYLREIVALPVVRDPRVLVIVWFNLQDNPNWPAGLLREDGSPKPSHAVFREIARGEQRALPRG